MLLCSTGHTGTAKYAICLLRLQLQNIERYNILFVYRDAVGLPKYDEYGQRIAREPLSPALQQPDTASDTGRLSLNATRKYYETWRENENVSK